MDKLEANYPGDRTARITNESLAHDGQRKDDDSGLL